MLARSKEDSTSPVANGLLACPARLMAAMRMAIRRIYSALVARVPAPTVQVWACLMAKLSEIRLSGTTSPAAFSTRDAAGTG